MASKLPAFFLMVDDFFNSRREHPTLSSVARPAGIEPRSTALKFSAPSVEVFGFIENRVMLGYAKKSSSVSPV